MKTYMNEIRAIQLIEQTLDKKRFDHSIRVAETAKNLAILHNASVGKVMLASLLHDYAKCQSVESLQTNLKFYELPDSLLNYHYELWHGPVAAKILKHEHALYDEAVLNAIHYHTTARANMSLIELIVFVADYIEPARKTPGIAEVRKLAEKNIVEAAQLAIKNTIIYLMENNAIVHPDSFAAYNMWTRKLQGGM